MSDQKGDYYLVEGIIEIDGEKIIVYGVGCRKPGISPVYNISNDREKVQKLVDMFNQNDLAPIHLNEVCEDSII